jgi:hypothetical protein
MKHLLSILILSFLSTLTLAANGRDYERSCGMGIDEAFNSAYQTLKQRNF